MALEPDLDEARRFLRALDPRPGATFHCQTYSDVKAENDLRLARVVVVELGAADEVLALNRLASLNRQGAGAFVSPSELKRAVERSNPTRRKDQYVRARAIVADDCGPECFALRPSLVVRTSRDKLQAYWLLDLDEPPLEEAAFKAIVLAATKRSKGDPLCKPTLEHVFRLPGFVHAKDPANPFRSKVELAGDERWTVDDLIRLFPPEDQPRRAASPSDVDRGTVSRALLAECLATIPATDFKRRNRDPKVPDDVSWFDLMAACHHATDGDAVEEFVAWCSTDPAFRRHSRDNFLQWRSLDGRGGEQITSATLAYVLRRYGEGDLADRVLYELEAAEAHARAGSAPQWIADELDPRVAARKVLAKIKADEF